MVYSHKRMGAIVVIVEDSIGMKVYWRSIFPPIVQGWHWTDEIHDEHFPNWYIRQGALQHAAHQ